METQRAAIEAARAAGRPAPEIYPHPDDIVFVPGETWRLVGPATKNEAAEFETVAKMRDLYFVQSMLGPPPDAESINFERLIAETFDYSLPPRMRLDDMGWFQLSWRHRRLSKRDLMKHLQQGWRDLGINVPRGTVLPEITAEQFEQAMQTAAAKLRKT